MATQSTVHEDSNATYIKIFVWLAVLTGMELGIVYWHIARAARSDSCTWHIGLKPEADHPTPSADGNSVTPTVAVPFRGRGRRSPFFLWRRFRRLGSQLS